MEKHQFFGILWRSPINNAGTTKKSQEAMKRSGSAFVELNTKGKLSMTDFTGGKPKGGAIEMQKVCL